MPLWPNISGETPIDDVSGLKIKGITTRRQLSEFEARNVSLAVSRYLSKRPTRRTAPFHYSWCLKVHREMFGRVWRWTGQVRTHDLNLGVAFHQIPQQLHGLLLDLECWSSGGMELIEQSARLHHRAVQIHPFLNGNGRWARLLANVWLRRNAASVVLWPEETLGEQSAIRQEYLRTIQAADQFDYEPLLDLHRRYQSPGPDGGA